MAIIESIATGVSLLDIGKTVYNWVTGQTVIHRLDNISARLRKLDDHIYYFAQQEVWDKSTEFQKIKNDLSTLKDVAINIQRSLGTDLVLSTPIDTPDKLQAAFRRNPEEFLFDITPLRGQGLGERYHSDPTLVPVTFTRWGQEFVGLIKVGYLRDYLDLEYRSQSSLIVPSSATGPKVTLPGSYNVKLWRKIVEIIVSKLGVDGSQIAMETDIVSDLGADSLDAVELVMEFEKAFNLQIPDEDAEKIRTVGEVYHYLIRKTE